MSDCDMGIKIELEKLMHFAENVAFSMELDGSISTSKIADQIVNHLKQIKTITASVSEYAATHTHIPQEIEWLLDNWYIAEREGKAAVNQLKYVGKLRCTGDPRRKTVIGEAAASLIRSGNGEISEERIKLFLDAFQNKLCLSERELAVFIPILKSELIIELGSVCRELKRKITAGNNEKDMASLMGNIFTSLRFLSNFDASQLLEDVNRIEITLRKDPAGLYEYMDELTRYRYRYDIARLARKRGVSEDDLAKELLQLAQAGTEKHVGYYIYIEPLGKTKKTKNGGLYISFIVLISLFLTILIGFLLDNLFLSLLLFFPISEIMKNITDFFVIRCVHPKHTPRLELKNGVPPEGRTICVVSTLLTSKENGIKTAKLLEEYKLSNRDAGENLLFGILADLPESNKPVLECDNDAIESTANEIELLNKKYGGGFFLFYRHRVHHAKDGKYMGWERKRGAILELVRLLRGRKTSHELKAGVSDELQNIRYIIALDSDTRLCAGSAKELIGASLHPLNTPTIDTTRGIVISGNGILQPRISVDLTAASRSDFTRIFAGQGGIDPYSSASSDVYQDLFDEGSFAGKGIIHVDAYLACLDERFPESTVLSHDLLEGAYLRCAYVGDTELTDGFPSKVLPYYDRLHRWTRGDWQSSPWMFRKVKNATGEMTTNQLSQISRWKIFDNLRRSFVPVFTLVALVSGMLINGIDFAWAAAIAVLSALSDLIISSAALMFRSDPSRRGRYYSTIISGFRGWFLQTLIRLLLLPYEAWVCSHAILTALYRMNISHKNMLSWVTAAETEIKTGNSVIDCYLKMWPCVLIGLMIILFTPYPSAAVVGIIWALSPLIVLQLSKEINETKALSPVDARFLTRCAGDIWRYFDELLTASDNYLPPDNWQEQPAVGIAHRTSPTNIGLAMLAALCAFDLGLCTKQRTLGVIENILETIKRLPKWNGHLFNWYDTQTLKVLEPAYISTVDSGNLVGSLIALREGLGEHDITCFHQYFDELINSMNFIPLYDRRRNLFHIGWDMTKNAPTEGWYDLMASEARQTSYLTIARGIVPRKHWRKLSRALVSQDHYSGMASWTGTMFEYLMPNLLLPCYKNSLIYESLKFCVNVQKRRCDSIPWGISESAFYDFDNALNYRYKAHGVQRLALKRGQDRETVISPYSTFLALTVDHKSAIRNLQELQKLGMEGHYGFYEAVDFTPRRQNSEKYEIVKTYMAHHLGMSILAINNVLHDNIMQKRFMRDREMASFAELLQEKVPVGEIILRQPPREIPEKPLRAVTAGWSSRLEGVDLKNPRCCVLSNGAYNVLLTEAGQSRSKWGNITLTKFHPMQYSKDSGMSFFLKVENELISLLPAPFFDSSVSYSSEFTGSHGIISARKDVIISSVEVTVPQNEAGELRTVEMISGSGGNAELICYFEPILSRLSDYRAHPAFSKLSIETSYQNGSIVMKRRAQGKEHNLYLCFSSDAEMRYDTSREISLGRGGIKSLSTKLENEAGSSTGSVLDPCVLARVQLNLSPGEIQHVRFALALASTEKDAINAANRILSKKEQPVISRLDHMARQLHMNPSQVEQAMARITEIIFAVQNREQQSKYLLDCCEGQKGLWPFSISGDLPILTAILDTEEDYEKTSDLIREHSLLTQNGIGYDLVILLPDGGDYRRSIRMSIIEIMRTMGCECNNGVYGGIHLIDKTATGTSIILSSSVRVLELGEKDTTEPKREINAYPVETDHLFDHSSAQFTYSFLEDGCFNFVMQNRLPSVVWSHLLSNHTFGFLATDCGVGHMWHLNARENKINRWLNDSLATEGTEKLEFWHANRRFSLFAALDGCECAVTYGFGFAVWKKTIGDTKIKTTAFVPMDTTARVFLIETENMQEDSKIAYFTELVLGDQEDHGVYVRTDYHDNLFSAVNLYNPDFPCDTFYLLSSELAETFTGNSLSWFSGNLDQKTGSGMLPCAAAIYPINNAIVIVTGCDDLEQLKALATLEAARGKFAETITHWKSLTEQLKIKTPDIRLNEYLNGWALYQTMACRLFGRTSLYQSGGAYGFRDQLQDVCALIDFAPQETVLHLFRAASHQFEEGDVQHWWHPGSDHGKYADKGVRTRCSDDLLWLPYALCEYVEKTGQTNICEVTAHYLISPLLTEDEQERYEQPTKSTMTEPLLNHAMRAVDLVLTRGTGEHGLCLIGTGDWNDGMNLVGAHGKGESVWLTWFAIITAKRLAALCDQKNEFAAAERYRFESEKLRIAADLAWDGCWYLRGYYDDGTPLGSSLSDECQIDSIAQSFAVPAGGDPEKIKIALTNAIRYLYEKNTEVVKLFSPPFSSGKKSPGYIKGYSPGFRENGGQYTHGAVWLAMGLLMADMTEEGWDILSAILPQQKEIAIYKAEPFVLAADVYANKNHMGRGGWTWYTGASGWFYRVATSDLLGLKTVNGRLFIEPNLPSSWDGYEACWKTEVGEYTISVKKDKEYSITVNGAPYDESGYPMKINNIFIPNHGKL